MKYVSIKFHSENGSSVPENKQTKSSAERFEVITKKKQKKQPWLRKCV